jgi:hypothetical protein
MSEPPTIHAEGSFWFVRGQPAAQAAPPMHTHVRQSSSQRGLCRDSTCKKHKPEVFWELGASLPLREGEGTHMRSSQREVRRVCSGRLRPKQARRFRQDGCCKTKQLGAELMQLEDAGQKSGLEGEKSERSE